MHIPYYTLNLLIPNYLRSGEFKVVSQTNFLLATPDWQCVQSSRDSEGDSGCDDSQGPESGDRPVAPLPDDRPQESDPVVFELNQIMDTLQQNLPDIPVGGPEKPQTLGSKPSDGGCSQERSSLPVPTPCRADSKGPEVDPAKTTPALKTLKAHEDDA